MPTTVSLQAVMEYWLIPLWVLFFILVSPLIIKIRNRKLDKQAANRASEKTTSMKVPPLGIKESYVNKLLNLKSDFQDEKRSSRECYQLLSYYIREYVKEYAGLDVTVKTLAEIRGMRLPKLEKLIEEYYACEFSLDAKGDFNSSVENTIDVIRNW